MKEAFAYFLTEEDAVFATAVVFEAMDEVLDFAAFAEEELGRHGVERHLAEEILCQGVVGVVFVACFGHQEAACGADGGFAFEQGGATRSANSWKQEID